jgi:protein-S-isoprenylcysteine O-methyltransferase Ste14
VYELLLWAAIGAAVVRSAWLLIGLVRVIPVHLRARTRRWGGAEVLAFIELPVFLALTCLLLLRRIPAPAPGGAALWAAACGAALGLSGLAVSLWAIATTVRRRVILDAGHFVKEEHPLLTTGAYGFVRNPMYLGIILIWFGLGVALQSGPLLLVSALYVVPVMWFYIRAEERMLASEFGAPFEEYARRVGRLLPRMRRRSV